MTNPESYDPLEAPESRWDQEDLMPVDMDAALDKPDEGDENLAEIDAAITSFIEELRSPLSNILRKLGPKIDTGAYSTVIVDDASGRIPGLMMREIMNTIYAENNTPPVITRFIAGSTIFANMNDYDRKRSLVEGQMLRIKKDAEKRRSEAGEAIIVTDTIASGDSVSMLLSGIRSADWSADVATIAALDPAVTNRLKKAWSNEVTYGTVHTPSIYRMSRASGVKKNTAELYAKPLYTNARTHENDPTNPADQHKQDEMREGLYSMRAARAAAKRIAKEIAKDYIKSQRPSKR